MSFIFNMLNLYINSYIVSSPFILILLNIWFFFLKNNFLILKFNISNNDVLKTSKFNKKIHFVFFFNWVTNLFLFLFLFLFLLKLDFNSFWFDHLRVDNFTLYLVLLLIIFCSLLIFLFKFVNEINYNYNIDYYFSLINICIFMVILFFCNNLFSTLFILELNSLLFLYKFSVSKFFSKKKIKNKTLFESFLPKQFLNMLFFQYWINFFSSILLMFFIFNIIYFYGSSNWFLINILNFNHYNFKLIILFFIFSLGLLMKLGIAPNNLFKVEIYKGLPFISLFFYSVFYFFIFLLLFVNIIYKNLFNFNYYFWFFFFIFIFLGIFYTIFLIFDINFFKSFFAYSTIINTLIFFVLFLSFF